MNIENQTPPPPHPDPLTCQAQANYQQLIFHLSTAELYKKNCAIKKKHVKPNLQQSILVFLLLEYVVI